LKPLGTLRAIFLTKKKLWLRNCTHRGVLTRLAQ